ncbi:MAG: tail fiber domain-containing protein [Candidatus Saccharibacteria bacterium]
MKIQRRNNKNMMSRKKFTVLVFVLGVVSILVFIFYAKIANAAVANPRFLNKVYIKWNGDDYVDVNPYDGTYSYEKGSTDCRDTIDVLNFDSKTPQAKISIQTYNTQQDGKKTCTLDKGYPKTISMDGVNVRKILGYKTSDDTIVLFAGAKKRTDSDCIPSSICEHLGIDLINGKPVMHTYVNPPKNEWNSPADKNRYKQLKDGAEVNTPDSTEKYLYVQLDAADPSKGTLFTLRVYFNFAHYDKKVGDIVLANTGKITPLPEESKITSANGGSSTADPGDALQTCEVKLTNPLTWVVCPMINGARDLVAALNSTINDMLTLPTDKLFVTTNEPANQFYDSWSGFRYIAMGLLVIIALIMVLSQAIGVGPFDAYTIRKVLPRLLAAVVLVSLSWPLMKLAVEITNGIGHSISGLIYGPFSGNLENNNPSILVMGTAAIGGIIGAFTFGLFGTLAFVATAALSMISGMATLIFREMLIMFLVVVAPVAIICSILPNTQTVWKKWSDYFLRALIVFPIFSGVIAIGQVFAVLGSQLHDDTLGSIISFAGYFGPYFMLPKIFAMSGGAVAAVGSVAQKATAGMRGGLKGFSQNRRKQIHENRMNAKGRLGGSSAGGVYRRLASGGAHGSWSMREGGREKWKAKEKKTLATSSAEMLKEGGDAAFADDDASSLLRINGLSRQGFIDGYTSGGRHTETEANAALGRAEIATGAKVGTTAMATAATAYRHSVSTTAFLPTTAGKMQQRNELRYAVAEGLITQDDATILQKSNKGRLDQSAGGFQETQGFLFGTGPHAAMTADEHTANAFKNSDPREILAANPKTSEAFAVVALNNGIAAVAGGIPQEVDRRLGDLANIHSSMSSTSPARANEFEATVLSRPSGIMGTRPDPMDKTKRVSKELTWREAIDDARADEPGHSTFHDRIREYSRDPSGFSSDSRLKRNIQQLGVSVSGIKIYKFQYIWSDVEYVGVLAQELLSEHRHAVIVDDSGYYKVDYSKIDVEMMLYKDWKHRVMASN